MCDEWVLKLNGTLKYIENLFSTYIPQPPKCNHIQKVSSMLFNHLQYIASYLLEYLFLKQNSESKNCMYTYSISAKICYRHGFIASWKMLLLTTQWWWFVHLHRWYIFSNQTYLYFSKKKNIQNVTNSILYITWNNIIKKNERF